MHPNRTELSSPQTADVHLLRGKGAGLDSVPDLLIEVPHGSTDTRDFEGLAAELEGPLPDGLVDFFHVNTDVGAFELALATAEHLLAEADHRTVIIVRSRIPRTFIDCNRRIDANPDAFREGGVTPGVMPWVRTAADWALLRGRYDEYLATVRVATEMLAPGGAVLVLHTYAPRSVGVEVDEQIVENLHRAYRDDVVETWPLRPELDVIARDMDGRSHAPQDVVAAFRAGLADYDWTVGDSETYPLHPSTLAWDHVVSRPGLALCLEVRRDLLADPWIPFAPIRIDPQKTATIARPLAEAIRDWGSSRGRS